MFSYHLCPEGGGDEWTSTADGSFLAPLEDGSGGPMTESHLSRVVRERQRHAEEACADLGVATREAGCPFPDLAVVPVDPATGVAGVDLGVVEPKMADRLAEIIRAGVGTLAAEDRPAERTDATVTPLWMPSDGDPVVDMWRGMVGTYSGPDGELWRIAPLLGGEPWTADPKNVRAATVNERVRMDMVTDRPVKAG